MRSRRIAYTNLGGGQHARAVHRHRRLRGPCRDQLRLGGADVASRTYARHRYPTLAIEQPRDGARAQSVANANASATAADALADTHAYADTHADADTGARDRNRSRASDHLPEPGAVQRAADHGYRELRVATQYLVLRSGAQGNRRGGGDGDQAG